MAKQQTVKVVGILEDTRVQKTALTGDQISKEFVGITGATKLLGFAHAQYTRRLVIEGKLEAIKVQLPHYSKWFISRAGIKGYLSGARRTTSHRRYILKMDLDQEQKVRDALKAAGVEFDLELAYKGKDEEAES